ncbi:hypothetical protein [Nocardia abscessus]|uniref:hypothetical protein n=1 Tax=Nocardia abscessus TaxID=120957 RepID=UPI002458741D|nr:hypothetical protein [Nocardia abscessus]
MSATVSAIAAAAVLGLKFSAPLGRIEPRGNWLGVGSVIVADRCGLIKVVPRHGIDHHGERCLLAFAVQSAIHGPDKDSGTWIYHPRLGWVTDVRVRRYGFGNVNHAAAECEGVQA